MATREQFLRILRNKCKKQYLELNVDKKLGKGSHYRVSVDGKKSTIKSGELSPQYMKLVTKQLGLK